MPKLLTALAVVAIAMFGVAAPAAAATNTSTTNLTFDGTGYDTTPATVLCAECEDTFTGLGSVEPGAKLWVYTEATWNPSTKVDLSYDPSQFAQGTTAGVTGNLTGQQGWLSVTWHIVGSYGLYGVVYGNSAETTSVDTYAFQGAYCTLQFGGTPTLCTVSATTTIFQGDLDHYPGSTITLNLSTSVAVNVNGISAARTVTVGGNAVAGPSLLPIGSPTSDSFVDSLTVPCSAPIGGMLHYDLASSEEDASSVATIGTHAQYFDQAHFVQTSFGFTIHDVWGDQANDTGDMTMQAPSTGVDLGQVLPTNIPPTADAGGPYSGNEGSPIAFAGLGSGVCSGSLDYSWAFSDGGVAFGPAPTHAFRAPGSYTGRMTVTQPGGLSSSNSFGIQVTNLPPVVSAGADASAAWGRLIGFTGTAIDPGADDQATLSYSWDFGDGSPVASGNGLVHSYTTPGAYTATFTACDRWGACNSATRVVTVRKHGVAVSYAGDQAGTYATHSNLRASVVDEFGSAVVGRQVAFSIGNGTVSESEGLGLTDASGNASVSPVIGLDAGQYTVAASFAGDSLYAAGAGNTAFTVGRKATAIVYTGATSGRMNAIATLSAILRDAAGTPIAGGTVTFQLGSQSASAITDANGYAVTALKLSQKIGTYSVTATYTPAGSDVNRYLGSFASATFKLNTK